MLTQPASERMASAVRISVHPKFGEQQLALRCFMETEVNPKCHICLGHHLFLVIIYDELDSLVCGSREKVSWQIEKLYHRDIWLLFRTPHI